MRTGREERLRALAAIQNTINSLAHAIETGERLLEERRAFPPATLKEWLATWLIRWKVRRLRRNLGELYIMRAEGRKLLLRG